MSYYIIVKILLAYSVALSRLLHTIVNYQLINFAFCSIILCRGPYWSVDTYTHSLVNI